MFARPGGTGRAREGRMRTKPKTSTTRRKHFQTAQTRRLILLSSALVFVAILQNVPWLVSNDFGADGPGTPDNRPASGFGSEAESAAMDASAAQNAPQTIQPAFAHGGNSATPDKSGSAWSDDYLVVYEGSQAAGRVAEKFALSATGIASASGSGGGSIPSSGGSFFVPFSSLAKSALSDEAGGGGSLGRYGGGVTVSVTSSAGSLPSLSVVSP